MILSSSSLRLFSTLCPLQTGRRKASVARVWVSPGEGNVVVNGKILGDYFVKEHNRYGRITEPYVAALLCRRRVLAAFSWWSHFSPHRREVTEPLRLLGIGSAFNVKATVRGGGLTGAEPQGACVEKRALPAQISFLGTEDLKGWGQALTARQ